MAKASKSVKDKRHKKHKTIVTLASRANERPECSDATCFLSLNGLIDSLKSADPTHSSIRADRRQRSTTSRRFRLKQRKRQDKPSGVRE